MQNIPKIYNLQSLNFLRNCHLNIGILGGSFDPAHIGHLLISEQAIKILNLDYIIWLVALQNPLKKQYKLDIFSRSVNAAQIVIHPRILVSSAEYDIGSNNTYTTLQRLRELFSTINFIFLMGIDNINNFHKWYRYQDIPNLCKIVVFDRPNILGRLNVNRFITDVKISIDTTINNNITIYRGIMSEISSSLIRANLKE